MSKRFNQWVFNKKGIKTKPGSEYLYITKEDIINRNSIPVKNIRQNIRVNIKDFNEAYDYACRYFCATAKYTMKSHPDIYKEMITMYNNIEWYGSAKGYTTKVPEGFNITIYSDKKKKDRWRWVFDGLYSLDLYDNAETAQKKAFASYYWLYKHIKNSTTSSD